MQLVTYKENSGQRGGVLVDDTVFDLERMSTKAPWARKGTTSSLKRFLELYGDNLAEIGAELIAQVQSGRAESVGTRSTVKLTAPVPDPTKVLCVGLNYKDHVAETGRELPTYPDVFAKFASTMIGPQDDIAGASVSPNLDFEGELAVVIGRTATCVDEQSALSYVAGVAPLNDISARDLQYRGTQWLAGKCVDGSTPWGPSLVTLDEVGDVQTLELVTRVNGIEMQRSNTRHQIFPVARIVSYLSSFLTLEPGDVIATGTPQGIGAKRNPPIWLNVGDDVEIDIERVGVLRNRIGSH